MAGIGAVAGSLRDGCWYRCSDGTVTEPLDILHLLFPNEGRDTVGENVCYVPKRFEFPTLLNLLPSPTEYFTPEDIIDSMVALLILCAVTAIGMVVCKGVWNWLDPKFAAVNPAHKKWYVIANLYKSFFLACMTFSSRYWIANYREFMSDEFQIIEVKRTMAIYIVADVVALFMVPKLPQSTIMHHVATAALFMVVSSVNLTNKGWGGLLGVCKMVTFYGIVSAVSYLVNAYLALRVVYPKAKLLTPLVKLAMWIYIICCTLNWTGHAVWLVWLLLNLEISIYSVLYILPIAVMVRDDVVLIRWLVKRGSPMAADSGEGKSLPMAKDSNGKKES